ncbi:MAG: endonuclease [Flavobacteriales bacterium]|nr:endonuclease [Flavobacteriales bacterium]
MKKITTMLTAMLTASVVFGQTTLPASWNFDDPTPTGWTESLDEFVNGTRYTNGFVGAACKLDADDEYVTVHFSDVCGGVTYNLKGQGTAVNDIFTVQESVNGTTWTTLRTFNQAALDQTGSSFVEFTDFPAGASRYIRWYFTEKQSGRNIALDEISLIPQVPTNAQEIGVREGTTQVVNNGTLVVGNQASVTISIDNVNLSGGSALAISNVQLGGTHASDFSLGATPTSVAAASTEQFQLNFTAGASGSRFATLTITNDDANGDETTFVINLYGIGGNFATEPTAAPTNMTFANVATYGYQVNFSNATVVPENYIVVRSIGSAPTGVPADGSTYVKGDYINATTQVVHVGPAGSFKPTYNVAGTTYHFAAYSFNGPAGYENYFTTTPLNNSVTTPATMMGNYYAGIDANASTFLTDLQTRISQNYSQIFYGSYAPIMIDKFASRDTTDGQKVVTGVYSGFQYLYTGAFFYDVMSREHSWPHSWMPAFPSEDGMEYSDLHNLFPTHQDNANAVRSNRPLGEVVANSSTFLNATYGDDSNGNRVYEPRDQHKGDAARAIFYMATKWNGTAGTWELPNPIDFIVTYGQDQDVLKQWHLQDPPDAWEIARNDFIESEQGNRNPFVDSVNWVCYIDFDDLSYISNPSFPCTTTPDGIEDKLVGDFSVSPNPSNGLVTLNLNLIDGQDLTMEIMDIAGRMVSTRSANFNAGISRENFDLSRLDAGVYHMVLRGERGSSALKIVLQ